MTSPEHIQALTKYFQHIQDQNIQYRTALNEIVESHRVAMMDLKERQEETLRSRTRDLERNLDMEKLRVRELENDNRMLRDDI